MYTLTSIKMLRNASKATQMIASNAFGTTTKALAGEVSKNGGNIVEPPAVNIPKSLADDLKATLTDKFGRQHRYLRISLSERCNLRYTSSSKSMQSPFMQTNSLRNMTSHLLSASNRNAFQSRRYMSTKLSHVSEDGKAKMVDVADKTETKRTATAKAVVNVGPEIAKLIQENSIAKGDVLSISQIAGIIAAKRTSEFIPLCHNIPLSSVNVRTELDITNNVVNIFSTVKCEGKTGVEMEALTAAATAALVIYDMCKAISQNMVIGEIMLMHKSGGKTNYQRRSDGKLEEEDAIVLKYKTDPIDGKETVVPPSI